MVSSSRVLVFWNKRCSEKFASACPNTKYLYLRLPFLKPGVSDNIVVQFLVRYDCIKCGKSMPVTWLKIGVLRCPDGPWQWQGSDLRRRWFLVGTPSAIRPELASRRAEHSLPFPDVTIYSVLIYNICYLCCLSIDFFITSTLVAAVCLWSVLKRFIYTFFKCVPFWLNDV